MSTQEWRESLKEGDTVLLKNFYGKKIGRVERTTAASIVVRMANTTLDYWFRKATGRCTGYRNYTLEPCTSKDAEAMHLEALRGRLYGAILHCDRSAIYTLDAITCKRLLTVLAEAGLRKGEGA